MTARIPTKIARAYAELRAGNEDLWWSLVTEDFDDRLEARLRRRPTIPPAAPGTIPIGV